MGGGLMQLVAQGAQDAYLTGKPEITFFKIVYRRHTAFAVESISQTLNGSVDYGNEVTATISRNGDLVNNLLMEIKTTGHENVANTKNLGFQLIKQCEIEIGGQKIDRQYGTWMNVWTELTHSAEKKKTLSNMVDRDASSSATSTLFVPLQFWFCRDNGLALPLIALQYHEVKLTIKFETKSKAAVSSDTLHEDEVDGGAADSAKLSATLYADYVYLDTDERKKFAQAEHEYLIEQVQESKETLVAGDNKFRLNFNHPVKELVWVTPSEHGEEFGQYSKNIETAKLVLNGHERMSERSGDYFNYVQPYQHHTGCPPAGVYVYSFALNPEKHQPSGTCNFSRIDNATLEVHCDDLDDDELGVTGSTMYIYAHNYNVLRIMSGMGGLAYSN
jgi:hypothetical protein